MDVRIGVVDHQREIGVKLHEDADRKEVKSRIDAALSGSIDTLWLTDHKGGEVGVAAARIAFVEMSPASESPIGFG